MSVAARLFLLDGEFVATALPQQLLLRQFIQKSTGFATYDLTEFFSLAGVADGEYLAGASDADVSQTPFFDW